MKDFDDHLDNYGDPNPGHEPFYAETWDGPGDEFEYDPDIPDYEDDEPCLLCGFYSCLCDGIQLPPVTAKEILSDESAESAESSHDYQAWAALWGPEGKFIRKDDDDDGITTDDFDNFPSEREFPS